MTSVSTWVNMTDEIPTLMMWREKMGLEPSVPWRERAWGHFPEDVTSTLGLEKSKGRTTQRREEEWGGFLQGDAAICPESRPNSGRIWN